MCRHIQKPNKWELSVHIFHMVAPFGVKNSTGIVGTIPCAAVYHPSNAYEFWCSWPIACFEKFFFPTSLVQQHPTLKGL